MASSGSARPITAPACRVGRVASGRTTASATDAPVVSRRATVATTPTSAVHTMVSRDPRERATK